MQNSILKLLSIAGVIGIGTLVVMEVHQQLPLPQQTGSVSEGSSGTETELMAPTTVSEFEASLESAGDGSRFTAGARRSTTAAAMDENTDPFSFTEPDLSESPDDTGHVAARNHRADAAPYAPDTADSSAGQSVPVHPAGFGEDLPDSKTSEMRLPGDEDSETGFSVDLFPDDGDTGDSSTAPLPDNLPDDFPDNDVHTAAPFPDDDGHDHAEEQDDGADTVPVRERTDISERRAEPKGAPRDSNTLMFISGGTDAADGGPSKAPAPDESEDPFFLPDGDPEPFSPADADAPPLKPAPDTFEEPVLPLDDENVMDHPDTDDRSSEHSMFEADEQDEEDGLTIGSSPDSGVQSDGHSETHPSEFPPDLPADDSEMFDEILPESDDEPHSVPTEQDRLFSDPDDRQERFDREPPSRSLNVPDDERPGRYHTRPSESSRTRPPRSRLFHADPLSDGGAQPDSSRLARDAHGPSVEIIPLGGGGIAQRIPSDDLTGAGIVQTSASSVVLRPHLTVSKRMPEQATLGVPLTYTLVVGNEGQSLAHDVVVEDVVPAAARLERVDPPGEFDKDSRTLVWEFDELDAGARREIQVEITPVEQGVLDTVATVRFKAQVRTRTVVRSPHLVLETAVPREIRLGSEVSLQFLIRNDGDGPAADVVLRSNLPAGLSHPIGNDLEYTVGDLEPGDEREVILNVVAKEPGHFVHTSELIASGGAAATAESKVSVIGQQIQIIRRGPPRRSVGRTAVFENRLTNETAFPAHDILVVESVPEGMKFVRASDSGAWNPEDRTVIWRIDTIPAEETKVLEVELLARAPGDHESVVTVTENAGFRSAARHVTSVEEINHLGARISGTDHPVAIGETFGFDITVQNRGTSRATGVQLVIELPPGIRGVSTGRNGPQARGARHGQEIHYRFDKVDIAAGDEKVFRINLRALRKMSDAPVRARIRYDQGRNDMVTSESVTVVEDGP